MIKMVSKAGKQAEQSLIKKIRERGFLVEHTPASGGGTTHPLVDITFTKHGYRTYKIELKTTKEKNKIYIDGEQVEALYKIKYAFQDARIFICCRFTKLARGKYFVVVLSELRKTRGGNYVIEFKHVKNNPELLSILDKTPREIEDTLAAHVRLIRIKKQCGRL